MYVGIRIGRCRDGRLGGPDIAADPAARLGEVLGALDSRILLARMHVLEAERTFHGAASNRTVADEEELR